MLPSAKSAAARQPRKWTIAEDQKLREEVEAQKSEGEVKDWCRIASKLPGRTNKDCRKRWFNSVAGGLKKGQWAKSEDVQLARGVQQFGQKWTLVAEVVGSRSADQCAKRWQQSLDPELDRSEWRETEDVILIEAVQTLGRHWKDIQRYHFPGRSKNCIKNRFTVLDRRHQNRVPSLSDDQDRSSPAASLQPYHLNEPEATYSEGDWTIPHTQVSTPGTEYSWPFDPAKSFTTCAPQDSYSLTTSIGGFNEYPTAQSNLGMSSSPQLYYATTSVETPALMHMDMTNSYMSNNLTTHNLPYNSPVAMQGVLGPPSPLSTPAASRGPYPPRAPTSSPRPNYTAPYHEHEVSRRFRSYGLPSDLSHGY